MKIRIVSPPNDKTKGVTFRPPHPEYPRNYDTDKSLPGIQYENDTSENLLGTLRDLALYNGMDKKVSQMIQFSSGTIKGETFFADFLNLDYRDTETPCLTPTKTPEKSRISSQLKTDSHSPPTISRKNSQIVNPQPQPKPGDSTSSFQDKQDSDTQTPKNPAWINIYHQINTFRSQIQKIISRLGRDLKSPPTAPTLRKSPSLGIPMKVSNLLALSHRGTKYGARGGVMGIYKICPQNSGCSDGQGQNSEERTREVSLSKICGDVSWVNDGQHGSSRKISGGGGHETSIENTVDDSGGLLEKFFGRKMVNKYEKKF